MSGATVTGTVAGLDRVARPMRDLFLLMLHLQLGFEYEIDYDAADPALLRQLGEHAELAMRTIHFGLSAGGELLVRLSQEVETPEIPMGVMEALGGLIADLSEFAAVMHCLEAACQRRTADYAPGAVKRVHAARP